MKRPASHRLVELLDLAGRAPGDIDTSPPPLGLEARVLAHWRVQRREDALRAGIFHRATLLACMTTVGVFVSTRLPVSMHDDPGVWIANAALHQRLLP